MCCISFVEVLPMAVKYTKLWKLLIDKQMNKSDLREAIQTSPNTIAKMGKNEPVSLDVLMRICKTLQCDIGDIMEVVEEKTELPMADQAT
jgi:DNA-binding Xre family transcriptional regulator